MKQIGAASGTFSRAIIANAENAAISARIKIKGDFMADSPNVDEVITYLEGFLSQINFLRPGHDGSLGRDCAMTILRGPDLDDQEGIIGRNEAEVNPDGSAWPDISEKTKKRKLKYYGWDDIAKQTNQMLSLESLAANIDVQADLVTLQYGTGQPPSQSNAPTGYLSNSDKKVTDIEKAVYNYQRGVQFFGANEQDLENVAKVCQENINEFIKETNQANGF